MKIYARIQDGRVFELVEIPDGVGLSDCFTSELVASFVPVPEGVSAQQGDVYADGAFTKPEPPAPAVPQIVSMKQARLALLDAGLLDKVTAAIGAMESTYQARALIEWEFSPTVERDSSLVKLLAGALGLSDAALNTLFSKAATL